MDTTLYNGKEIPRIGQYDVVVIGGGFGGFSAAVAAAAAGAETLLIEQSGALGGMATLAGVPNFCTSDRPDDDLTGSGKVWKRVIDGLQKLGAIGEENGYRVKHNPSIHTVDHTFSAAALEMLLLHMAKDGGVTLMLHTEAVDTQVTDGTLTHVIVHNESLLQAVACKVVIDGTGCGSAALHGGGEALPEEDGTAPIPPAFRIFLYKAEAPVAFQPTPAVSAQPLPYSVHRFPGGAVMLKINLKGEQTTSARERNAAELSVKSRVLATVEDFRSKYGAEYVFWGLPAAFPVREMRRIRGEYVLNAEDVRAGRRFDDAIAEGSFIIDTLYHHETVPPYDIPYRSLLVHNTKNLLVVGRCLSADRYAMSSARIMKTASQTGEAAGAAAALSCKKRSPLREISAREIRALLDEVFG